MIEALSTRLIIKQVRREKEHTTSSGIVLGSSSDDTAPAEVIAVGPDCKQKLAAGDRVMPIWQRVQHVRINGEDLFGIDEQDIIGRLK
jgi:co-chaperonin GroES (HSP10)